MTVTRNEIGLQAPPPEGYSIQRFEGYLEELEERVAGMGGDKDHRAVFEITYLVFSRQVLAALKEGRFEDMQWAIDLASRFIEVYRAQRDLWEQRDPALCRAWSIAFESMEEGRINVLQAMLLGINAHINYDLAFATFGACYHAGDLEDLGADHDVAERALSLSRTGVPMVRYRDFLVINQLEWEAIELIQDTVLRDYNRLLYWGNRLTKRSTRFMGQRILMEARDTAWLQTTLLVHARDAEERALIGRLVDAYAASLGDFVRAFTFRPDHMVKYGSSWSRRGERIDPELQASLVGMACRDPVIAELLLQQLAFAGAEPVSGLTMLIDEGEHWLAGLFGQMVLQSAPSRRKKRLARFLRDGSEEAVSIVEAMLLAGLPVGELPDGSPVEAVRSRWTSRLADNVACLGLPAIQARTALWDALADNTRWLRTQLHLVGGADRPLPDGRRLDVSAADAIVRSHSDPWVQACARAHLTPDSADSAGNGDAMSSAVERVLFLKETQVFMEVDTSVLIHMADKLETCTYDVGETIVRSDEHPGGLFLISDGDVEVTQHRDGKNVRVAQRSVHDSIGELSVLNGTPTSADCTALTQVSCFFLPSDVLSELLHHHPRLSIGLIRMLSQRLMSATLQVQG